MSEVCPHCNGTGRVAEADPVERLRQAALAAGHWVSPSDEVRTDAAAELLGVSSQWLRTQACYFDRIPSRRMGRHRLYSLIAIAAELERQADV